jgi:hypothetical protein
MVDTGQDFEESSMIASHLMLLSSYCLPIPATFRFNNFEKIFDAAIRRSPKGGAQMVVVGRLGRLPFRVKSKEIGANSEKLLMRARKFYTQIYRLILDNQSLCGVKLSSMEYRLRRYSRPVPLQSQLPSNQFVIF